MQKTVIILFGIFMLVFVTFAAIGMYALDEADEEEDGSAFEVEERVIVYVGDESGQSA